ncbi:MAG: NAD(P)/FAD-dependent oxidoreductase [Thermoproteota archaeon]
MNEHSPEVVIVGGGPCGSFTALNLARKGRDVHVYEEHDTIGSPCHCAGHLTLEGLRLLELHPLPSEIIENTYYAAVFHSPKGIQFPIRFSSPVTCSVNRSEFDKYLAKKAEEAGAHYHLNSRVNSLITHNGRVTGVTVKREKTEEKISAKVVVDAEGISSRILRQAGLRPSHKLVKAVQAEVDNPQHLKTDTVEIFLGKDYAPGFYAWLMPQKDDTAKVGLATRNGNPLKLLHKMMSEHPTASQKLRSATVSTTTFHCIPLGGPIPQTFTDGFLAVGDAASQVKPTTGGGVIFGMTCAKIAAQVIHDSLTKTDSSSNFLREYQRKCNKTLGAEIRVMLLIRKILDTLPNEKLDKIFSFSKKMELNNTLKDFKNVDFQAHSLLHLLYDPRLLATLLYSFLSYLSANPNTNRIN